MVRKMKNGIMEFSLKTRDDFIKPFWDIELKAEFIHGEKIKQMLNGFYDGKDENGDHIWRIRWMPTLPGTWTIRIKSFPEADGLTKVM